MVRMFRPLSKRGTPDPRFDEPQPGLPDYLMRPILEWMAPLLVREVQGHYGLTQPDADFLEGMQLAMRMEPPLDWRNGGDSAIGSLQTRMVREREFALDVLDFLLHFRAADPYTEKLERALRLGGSAWEVAQVGDTHQLAKRALGPVRESIEEIRSASQRAHHHLSEAWSRLSSRDPDASAVYREAIKAVESVARPVISPRNDRATLGTMIADMRNAPAKWTTRLDGTTTDDVRDMAEMIWKGQVDRHGSDDESVPLAVSLDEADAAFYVALMLVRWFAGGHIKPV
jgi:hypothetical protein